MIDKLLHGLSLVTLGIMVPVGVVVFVLYLVILLLVSAPLMICLSLHCLVSNVWTKLRRWYATV